MIPLDDNTPTKRFPFWVVTIILLNFYVFFLELTAQDTEAFIKQYALIPALVNWDNPETLLPFFTSQFLHGGWIHILSNMLFLWVFGDNVEERFGFFLFPIIYLLSGAVGGFAQYLIDPSSVIPMIGASGAVAGVLGAYFVFFPDHQIKTLVPIFGLPTIVDIPAAIMLIYWFISQLFIGVLSISVAASPGGIAYFAHIGGFTTGWLIASTWPNHNEETDTS